MKKLILLALVSLVSGISALAQTATITPSTTTYSAAGGTITFTANLSYSGTQSAIGMDILTVPATWTYGTTGGANMPQIAPGTGDTDNYSFAYFSIPASPASFTFTVTYPAGMTGDKMFSGMSANFRPTGATSATIIAIPNITITPAPTPPAISTQPTNQTVTSGANATFMAAATGSPTPSFQWRKGGVNLTNGTTASGTMVSGATSATLQLMQAHASDAGSYDVVATNSGGTATSNVATLTVNKASQTITFGALSSKTFGDAAFTLGASASSGLAVSYASSNTAVATVSGSTVTIVGAGTTTFTASQAGDADFNAATSVTQTLTVNKATASVSLGALSATFNGSPKAATAATTPTGLTVILTYDGSATAPTNVGSYAVVGTVNDNNYQGSATGTLVIAKGSQTIAFVGPGQKVFSEGSFTLTATASSGLPVTYATSNPSSGTVATISGTTVTFVNTGTITITASQPGNSNYDAATSVAQPLEIVPALQTITFAALPTKTFGDASFALAATASSGLTVSYMSSNTNVATISGNTVTIVGTGTSDITASQAGNANFGAAPAVTRTLTVNKAMAAVTLGSLNLTYDGSAKVATATTSPTGLTVNLTYNGSATAPTNAGSYTVVGTVVSDHYQGTATGTLIVAKANQAISFAALPSKTFGDAAFALGATADSGLAVSFASSNTGVASLSGNTVTILAGGSSVITAGQAGDANYNAAAPVSQTLSVAKAMATVSLTGLTHTYNGSTKGAEGTTSPSGLMLSFAYTGTASSTTVPTNAGSYGVTATIVDPRYQGFATGTLVINKADQTITFGPLPSQPLDSGNFTLPATASSGLAVSYATSNPSSGTVATVSGSTVTLVNTGTITLTATQPGDSNFNAATSVAQNLTVLNQSQTLTFAGTELTGRTFGNAPFAIAGSSNRGLPITFTSSNSAVATVGTGTLNGNTTTATVTIVGAGSANITATQAGDSNTAAATDVVRSLTVNKASATVTLTSGSLAQAYDGAPKAASATTNPAGLNVVFTYGTPTTSTPPTNVGTYAVTAMIDDANHAGSATGNLVISKSGQTITFASILSPKFVNAGSFSLVASSNSSLAVTLTSSNPAVASISGNVATINGLGTTIITANQAGDANYNPASAVQQTLVVNPVAPVIVSTPPTAVTAVIGSNFLFGPIGLNALSAPVTFSATGLPAGLTVNAASGNISGVPAASNTPGPFTIQLTVTNASGSDAKTINLTLQPPAPVITSPAAASAVAGTAFSYTMTATPASGVTLSAAGLPSWLTLSGATLTGTPTQAGSFTVQLTAANTTGSVTVPLVIDVTLPANAPIYSGSLNPSGTAGVAFSFTPNFGAGTATYALTGTLPSGLSFNSATGAISGTTQQVGMFPVSLSATRVGLTATADLAITVNPAAAAPVVGFPVPGNVRTATVGTAITSIQLTATPAATGFSATGLPAGLSMTSGGLISGTPTTPGTAIVRITASNTAGTGPIATMQITINPHPTAPVITSSPVVQGRVGVALNYDLTASSAGGAITPPAVTYGMTGTLPAGLNFNGAAGTVTGMPSAGTTGSYVVFFAGITTAGNFIGDALDVTFNIAPPLTVPVVNSNGTAAGQVGQSFNYVITASNSPASFAATGLPAGLTVNTTTGVISGVPTTATTGTPVTATLTAANGDGTSNPKTLLITIAPAPATPVITSGTTVSGRVGTAFTYAITATESPTSYVATRLPPGLNVNPSTGVIAGTPTQSGQFASTIAAASADGLGAPASLNFTIAAAASAPAISSAPTATGQVGTAFTYQITTSGGTATSYAVSGTLPAGLSLNSSTGAITGSPTTPGLVTVSLTATGDGGTSLPQSLVLTINPALGVPVVTSPTVASATVGSNFSYAITATNMPASTPLPPGTSLDAVNLPAGLAVNPSTGVIQGIPGAVGSTTASVFGTNAAGTGPTRDLAINVQAALTAPVVSSATVVSAQVGTNFSYQITASNSPTSFEVIGAPAWMTINSTTGALAGSPAAPGTLTVQLIAGNSAGASAQRTLTINVAAAPGTPVITSTRNTRGQVGAAFTTYQVTASPAATRFLATGLPSGLSLNATTGAITGTPTESGAFQVMVSGLNASGAGAPERLTFTILPRATLVAPGL